MSNRKALVIMLKNPVKGKVKTRLAKDVGDDLALDVYKNLLLHTQKITCNIDADKYIFYSDLVERNDIFDNTTYKKYVQCSGDLGPPHQISMRSARFRPGRAARGGSKLIFHAIAWNTVPP